MAFGEVLQVDCSLGCRAFPLSQFVIQDATEDDVVRHLRACRFISSLLETSSYSTILKYLPFLWMCKMSIPSFMYTWVCSISRICCEESDFCLSFVISWITSILFYIVLNFRPVWPTYNLSESGCFKRRRYRIYPLVEWLLQSIFYSVSGFVRDSYAGIIEDISNDSGLESTFKI
jgi:hypothetical protein